MATYPYRGRPAYQPPGVSARPAPFFAHAALPEQLYDPRLGLLTAHLFPEPPPPAEGLLSPKAMALDPYASDWPPVDPTKGLLWLAGSPLSNDEDTNTVAGTERGAGDPANPRLVLIPRRPLPMPNYIKKRYQEDWMPFHDALRDAGMLTEREIQGARTTFGFEGGMEPDPAAGGDEDPGVGGVTKSWLEHARDDDDLNWPHEADPNALSLEQIAEAYKVYIDEALNNVGEGKALARIGDQKMALEVFDTLFKHGRRGGAVVIQDAINALINSLPMDERTAHGLKPLVFEDQNSPRAFGEQTLDRMNHLIAAGYAKRLRGAIADQRAISDPPRGNIQARYDYFR